MVQNRFYQTKIINTISNVHWTFRWFLAAFTGGLAGIFVLMPINEYMIFVLYEHHNTLSFGLYLSELFHDIFFLEKPVRIVYYSSLGATMSFFITQILFVFQRYRANYILVREELNRNIHNVIENGENNFVEFKSSFRYDVNQGKVNKALEMVIMKTLAGFMNSEGGTLLIGVDDEGNILGLKNDYGTLKRKDKDGFEQLLMTTVANSLGTASCKLIHLNFHSVNDNEVCRLSVKVAPNPVYVKHDKTSKFYIRTGSGTREMELHEAVEYINEKYKV